MDYCDQLTISPLAIAHLVGIKKRTTIGCRREVRVAAAGLLSANYEPEDENKDEDGDEDEDEDRTMTRHQKSRKLLSTRLMSSLN